VHLPADAYNSKHHVRSLLLPALSAMRFWRLQVLCLPLTKSWPVSAWHLMQRYSSAELYKPTSVFHPAECNSV